MRPVPHAHCPSVCTVMYYNVSKNNNNQTINVEPVPYRFRYQCRLCNAYPNIAKTYRVPTRDISERHTYDTILLFSPKTERNVYSRSTALDSNTYRTHKSCKSFALWLPMVLTGAKTFSRDATSSCVSSTCDVIYHNSIYFYFIFNRITSLTQFRSFGTWHTTRTRMSLRTYLFFEKVNDKIRFASLRNVV